MVYIIVANVSSGREANALTTLSTGALADLPLIFYCARLAAMRDNKIFMKIKTKIGGFDCLFESNFPDKGYTVTVPKLRGVITFGDNMSESRKNIKEAIELHCRCLLEKGFAEVKPFSKRRTKELIRV